MNSKDAIRSAMDMGMTILTTYLSDLSDQDLLIRPTAGCNHLAWQLGHLISSEVGLLNSIVPGKGGELPPGFADQHGKGQASCDDGAKFCTKQEYIDLFGRVRAASVAALASCADADLDQPAPEHMRSMFPTMGHMFMLIANHPLMHAGQFVVVRRQLGKPVLI